MKQKLNFWQVFEGVLPFIALAWLLFVSYALFFLMPYPGFEISVADQKWQIIRSTPGNGIQSNDIFIRVGDVSADEAAKDLRVGFFKSVKNGQTVQIELLRDGQPLTISYVLPAWSLDNFLARLNSQWFIPYIFWLAGFGALLFLRPRGLLRRVFMLFCFLTASWVACGSISALHFMGGALALRALVWLSVPVYLHLHWLFPTPLGRLPGWLWGALYGLCALLALAALFQLLPQNFYLAGFALALLGSLVLLIAHVIKQPGERRALAGIAAAMTILLLPVVGMAGITYIRPGAFAAGTAVIGITALPGFYFFTLYIRQLTAEQAARSRRVVGVYFALVAGGMLLSLGFALYAQFNFRPVLYNPQTLVIPFALAVIALLSFLPFLILPALADERVTLPLGSASLGFSANRAASGLTFLFLEVLLGLALLLLAAPLVPAGWSSSPPALSCWSPAPSA